MQVVMLQLHQAQDFEFDIFESPTVILGILVNYVDLNNF